MTPTEEDALVSAWGLHMGIHDNVERLESLRLAIRAAVAAERERCAKVCEEQEAKWYRTKFQHIAMRCAAAIRRG